jgi:hypothetical protein
VVGGWRRATSTTCGKAHILGERDRQIESQERERSTRTSRRPMQILPSRPESRMFIDCARPCTPYPITANVSLVKIWKCRAAEEEADCGNDSEEQQAHHSTRPTPTSTPIPTYTHAPARTYVSAFARMKGSTHARTHARTHALTHARAHTKHTKSAGKWCGCEQTGVVSKQPIKYPLQSAHCT